MILLYSYTCKIDGKTLIQRLYRIIRIFYYDNCCHKRDHKHLRIENLTNTQTLLLASCETFCFHLIRPTILRLCFEGHNIDFQLFENLNLLRSLLNSNHNHLDVEIRCRKLRSTCQFILL